MANSSIGVKILYWSSNLVKLVTGSPNICRKWYKKKKTSKRKNDIERGITDVSIIF